MQCLESLWDLPAWVRIPSSELQTTSQQSTQMSILSRLVGEYTEASLRAQAVVPQAHISCIAAYIPYLRKQIDFLACLLACLLTCLLTCLRACYYQFEANDANPGTTRKLHCAYFDVCPNRFHALLRAMYSLGI